MKLHKSRGSESLQQKGEGMQKKELQSLIAMTETRVRSDLVDASVDKIRIRLQSPRHVIDDVIDVILDELVVQFEMEA